MEIDYASRSLINNNNNIDSFNNNNGANNNVNKNKNCTINDWTEKYRPARLDDIVGHSDIIATLKEFIKNGNIPNLLFYGPPGACKTSTALAITRELVGEDNVHELKLELNASDDRGIEVVRKQIKEFNYNFNS